VRGGETYTSVVVTTADGKEWRSPETSWTLGASAEDVAYAIEALINGRTSDPFHAWQVEKTPLILSVAFLAPLWFILLGLVLRLLVPRAWAERLVAAAAARRAERVRH
jgi:hypothetical protein